MLSFIGIGSAFNTEQGNNCAYIKDQNALILIDCGGTTFSSLRGLGILKELEHVFVLITHLHPDHIASLGDLIFYCRYGLNKTINIATPDKENVKSLLKLMGVEEGVYNIIDLNLVKHIKTSNIYMEIETIKVLHVETLNCYGYILHYNGKKIYYSGDAKKIDEEVLERFKKGEIQQIYQDTSKHEYAGNPHMPISELCTAVEEEHRHRVFCMHINEDFDTNTLRNLGFQVAERK